MVTTDDVRIQSLRPLLPPAILLEEIPLPEAAAGRVKAARLAARGILWGDDDRLLVVVGPCSIHDTAAALEYARLLASAAERLGEDLLIIMRVYFEKPRTTVGWKGLINDPDRDGTFSINQGLRAARGLLVELAQMGVPAGCEFLDTITPQFMADCVAWGAIGARTTESQVHRELASGLSMPVGFKNGTSGNVKIACDAVRAAAQPHRFLSVTKQGIAAIVATQGNDGAHIILRGGSDGPNFDSAALAKAGEMLSRAGLDPRMVIDCSHANSGKDHRQQPAVASDLAGQIAGGSTLVAGVMIESHLVGGRQDASDVPLVYGRSITDACVAWDDTVPMLEELAAAVRTRRQGATRK